MQSTSETLKTYISSVYSSIETTLPWPDSATIPF